ncbi:unnamed protein product [Darwinula stevensoni]|uniref:X-box-binding protein 1 n=1 Tax=Darwinula stevensoni TaxID=69355 RepID=A0A7R9AHN2_9CRUS|nr:unnamed protein product [Darwinula stevensoni]CAG0904594.1 unnamed protein product [Darwinula stevensoni]
MKTILIVPKGPSCPVRVVEFPSSPVVKREIEDEEMECPRRKKVKLDHLSSEEKMMRRKMKNRAAAQSARDRKKARMEELECLVKILEEQHSKLAAENKILRLQNEALEEENAELRRSLGMDGTTPIGPAESINAPLPREQGVKSQTVLNALFLQLLCLMQTKGSVSSSSLPPLSRSEKDGVDVGRGGGDGSEIGGTNIDDLLQATLVGTTSAILEPSNSEGGSGRLSETSDHMYAREGKQCKLDSTWLLDDSNAGDLDLLSEILQLSEEDTKALKDPMSPYSENCTSASPLSPCSGYESFSSPDSLSDCCSDLDDLFPNLL